MGVVILNGLSELQGLGAYHLTLLDGQVSILQVQFEDQNSKDDGVKSFLLLSGVSNGQGEEGQPVAPSLDEH